jgi:hypothetical protein
MGRPRKELTGEQVEQVEKMAGHGLTLDQIADCLNIGERTLERRFSEDTVVLAAYKRGKAVAINAVAKTVYQKAVAGEGAFPFFYLKTQAGWRETNRMEVTGADGGPVQQHVTTDSPREWIEGELARIAARQTTVPHSQSGNGRGA